MPPEAIRNDNQSDYRLTLQQLKEPEKFKARYGHRAWLDNGGQSTIDSFGYETFEEFEQKLDQRRIAPTGAAFGRRLTALELSPQDIVDGTSLRAGIWPVDLEKGYYCGWLSNNSQMAQVGMINADLNYLLYYYKSNI